MSSDVAALRKHECPACGAQAEWNPTTKKLVCPFCGTESPYVIDRETGQAEELDLVTALRELPEADRGWLDAKRSVKCQSCHAVMVFDATRVGQNCEFCGSPALVAYDEIKAPIRPRSVLPFVIDVHKVREDLKRWLRSRWFAPNRLIRSALLDRVHSVYIPYWTFDASAHCPWVAEAGHYYYVKVNNRRERRVRWEPAAGVVDHAFDDELVAGTHGIPLDLLHKIEPFPTGQLVPYDTAFLSGHVVEHYQVVLLEAAKRSRDQMADKLRDMAAHQIPGDTYRNLQISPQYSAETFKHILVPVWLLTYVFRGKNFQVVANGATGQIAGRYPLSFWKILFAVIAILIIVGIIVALNN